MPESRSLPARLLPWITWGLTFHILAIAVLFGALHVPIDVVRAIAAWKEMAVVALLGIVVLRAAAGRGPGVRVGAVDLAILAWLALAIGFFVTEDVVWGGMVPLKAAAYGVRDISFFVLLYFVGRGTPEIADDPRTLRRLYRILVLTSAIAIVEWLFVTPEMLVVLGVGSYVQDFLGTSAFTVNNVYGLPDNYWSEMGGHMVRRAGSIYLSSQGFASPFLIFFPAATMWVFRDERPTASRWVGYLVIGAGLVLSFTRAAIGICLLDLLIVYVYRKRPTGAALVVAAGAVAFMGAMVAFPGIATFAMETLTFQSGSSASHVKDWTAGVTAFAQAPWGYGLGTTDQTAVRAGLDPITADNQYLKYAVEMGLPGLLVHVASLALVAIAGYRVMRDDTSPMRRAFGVTVALGALGIAIDGLTNVAFNNPIVAYLFFWFAGTAVTLQQRLPRRDRAAAPVTGTVHA